MLHVTGVRKATKWAAASLLCHRTVKCLKMWWYAATLSEEHLPPTFGQSSWPPLRRLLLTDPAYVAHVSLQAGLTMLWHRCANRVMIRHVHAHKGHALNEIADRAAKDPPSRYFVRRMDYSRAYVPLIGTGATPLHSLVKDPIQASVSASNTTVWLLIWGNLCVLSLIKSRTF